MPSDVYCRVLHQLRDAVTIHIAVCEQCSGMASFMDDLNGTAQDLDAAIRAYNSWKISAGV